VKKKEGEKKKKTKYKEKIN